MQKIPLLELTHFVRNVLAVIALQEPKDTATVVALKGDLGAGKTTFTQRLAHELGITETVQSPTYVLMKLYTLLPNGPQKIISSMFDRLVHIDAYRLESPEEFATLAPEQFLHDPRALVVVEWPEKVGNALPMPDLTIRFSSEGATEKERYLSMEK
jgi:tRNA threonylcarbamoyladenosine biosynthesis protein TsaE